METLMEAGGRNAQRAFWLAIALATLSCAAILIAPLTGMFQAALYLAIAWGVRRGQWCAALTGVALNAISLVTVALRLASGDIAAGVAAAALWGIFGLACGYFFLRAALELRIDRSATQWPWIAGIGFYVLCMLCCTAYAMPSGSIEKTLLQNESVLVESVSVRLGRLPKRDEILIFRFPLKQEEVYAKRVAGIPGDRLKLVNKQLFRNGLAVAEPYAIHLTSYIDSYRDNFPAEPRTPLALPAREMLERHTQNGEVIVPAGKYFVLGDNRDDSFDSRYWGFVSGSEIIGRPVLIYASYNLEGGASTRSMASAFNTRWNRLLRIP